ncbi:MULTISPECIES: HK97 gp10 family phage protein [Bacillus]|uniref:HK97 gp10 family phage protein n=1 Tax=Bacillus halotolerans TaxID=260554 RepID=A0ABY7I561_9BACI|nr:MULTISPECIES: HK97 gp10 family phage protein [Bacillus]QQF64569.1 HK97 gp10 family phage protein [Bacillus mojavensis]BDG79573.1 phage-like element PBSX protein XkdI [Bacillus subtilis]KUP33775.1 phage portal protein [Bacillus halotolerans]KUP37012.1 phage portal protein [Bacillus halotolerans]MBL4968146.1 HK97 gp10 family phage protein [Bacillus halotolerans]
MKIAGLKQLNASLKGAASGGFSREASRWLEECGQDFLEIVQSELISTQTIDTEKLLSSFQKGSEDNLWKIQSGGLSLEVGTQLEYASFLNDGHWTSKADDVRWVPGHFQGSRFNYDPASSTGMALKKKWIPGTSYWEHALLLYEQLFAKSMEHKLRQWLKKM